ncbi:CPBP family intramembrane glutamic endopeptidase [Bacillus sp. S/N-304-OC-R1]|uniref:CPBP family intramembrane glutamic endopeptidase n=1 Tax=Bacillus sp. S/N-304-OC-R1 TaxID=2758034 RepID=UPI001C8F0C90|nr:CPBP family intramembrane glutamic endopeptidase [Bacillus sp. S/N-304-OC-R1]MBY0122554.1 CPBP family intramembrane metalloprotease [Bacillus sp. S/N-304-OC-R1]
MKDKYTGIIKELTEKELLFHLYLTQAILFFISIILSIILFDRISDVLSLFELKDINILLIGGSAGLAVVLLDLIFMKILPPSYYDDGGLNERVFRNRGVLHMAVIAAIVAFCEELLFRGIIQTHVGLVITSLIFAVIHYRYLFNWFLFLNVVVLSFFIGYIFFITENLFVTIFMHFIIDFLLGLNIKYRHNKGSKRETGRDVS